MWLEFEWENKVAVRTSIPSLREYLDHLLKCTNMRCLTPDSALEGDCDFLAANLYARSVFGEDALANLSIDKGADGKVVIWTALVTLFSLVPDLCSSIDILGRSAPTVVRLRFLS